MGVPWEDSGVGTPSSIDTKSFGDWALPGCGVHALALSARDLLEPPQGLDVPVEIQDAVHGIQHHHVSTESTPTVRRSRPILGARLCMRSQPSMPNFAGSRPNDLSCSLNAPSHNGSSFKSEEHRRATWFRYRDKLMQQWARHGRRPLGWWCYEAPEKGLRYPGYEHERSILYEAGLLTEGERTELEAWWRKEFDRTLTASPAVLPFYRGGNGILRRVNISRQGVACAFGGT